MTANEKKRHSLFKCHGCLNNEKYRKCLAYLPVKNKVLVKEAQNAGLYKPNKTELKDITKMIVNDLNKVYKETFNTKFTTQFQNISSKQNYPNSTKRAVKEELERKWAETSVGR